MTQSEQAEPGTSLNGPDANVPTGHVDPGGPTDGPADRGEQPVAYLTLSSLHARSPLIAAIEEFNEYMLRKGFSTNTIKAFQNDLKILCAFLDETTPLRQISTDTLNGFLDWLQHGRGRPCSAKTLARRITTLKVFFGWLHGSGVLGTNPAEAVVQYSVRTPLPSILYDEEVSRLLRTAQDYLWDRNKPDARPYVLVSLLIQTGMKKGECANLLFSDIDVSHPQSPEVTIRYNDVRYTHKNRNLPLSPTLTPALKEYLTTYNPEHYLFECTPRNLEYILDEVGQKAEITRLQVGFETLRWTCAVRDFRNGMSEDHLRQKMGLSKVSWRDTREKIFRLAGRI